MYSIQTNPGPDYAYSMTRFVFMPTMMHTGTWTLLDVLLQHPQIKGFLLHPLGPESARPSPYSLLELVQEGREHVHWVPGGSEPTEVIGYGKIAERYSPDSWNILMTHIGRPDEANAVLLYALGHPTVSTIRDPLLSAISHRIRAKQYVDKWANYVLDPKTEKPLYYGQDLQGADPPLSPTAADRIRIWRQALILDRVAKPFWVTIDLAWDHNVLWTHLGLPDHAITVPINNSRSDAYPAFRRLYDRRDAAALKAELEPEWDLLVQQESELRPWLERLGYRDLLWWS
jgi:hypothetical protein